MNLSYLLHVLYGRRGVFLATLGIVLALAVGISLLLPKTYKATSQVVLDYRGTDPVAGVTNPGYMSPGYLNTYIATQIDIITSRHTALRVVDTLGLARDPETIAQFNEQSEAKGDVREWLSTQLLKNMDVDFARDSSVMSVTYAASNPERAAALANAFADQYRAAVIKLKAEPLQNAATYLGQQVVSLREDLERAQRKLSAYQQREGLIAGNEKVDIEAERLNQLSGQMLDIQAQRMEAETRYKELQRGKIEDSPDIIANPLIQNLKLSLAAAEGRFAQVKERFMPVHPQYISSKAEVDQLRSELSGHMRATRNSVGNTLRAVKQRESEIRSAFEEQKALLLRLRDPQDQLNVLAREVENAQKAFDMASQRLNQTTIESRANQTNVSLLAHAAPPVFPNGPRLLIVLVAAVFLGTLLGIGFAFLAEMFDRRLRTADQLVRLTGAPVLSLKQRRSRRSIGGSMLLLPNHSNA